MKKTDEQIEAERKKLEEKTEKDAKEKEEQKYGKLIEDWTNKLDLARKFIEIIPLFYDEAGMWWKWNLSRKCWELTDEIDIFNAIERSARVNIIKTTERNEILNALKQVARENKPKKVKPTILQFGRELVDIETGERSEASSEYFIVNPIPWKLGKSGETPTIDRIFEEWVGKDYVKTLYEIVAYCLLTDYPIQRLFCFVGEGLNGKTCFLRLLQIFLGAKNCVTTDLDILLKSRFESAKLYKKLLCQMGETNFNVMNKTSILKRLTGRDLMGFEWKNKTPFDDYNYAKIIIATNNLPTTTDKTIGFYRRWLLIDFPRKFSEKKEILGEIPNEEYESLAFKSVEMLVELLKKREFHNEGSVEEREKRYEDKSNPLKKFWDEQIAEEFEGKIFKYEFRKNLDAWCREQKYRKLSDTEIAHFLTDKGISSGYKQIDWLAKEGAKEFYRAWIGIDWKKK